MIAIIRNELSVCKSSAIGHDMIQAATVAASQSMPSGARWARTCARPGRKIPSTAPFFTEFAAASGVGNSAEFMRRY